MLFLKNFYDAERKVNKSGKWVWMIHALSYSYIIYVFYFSGLKANETSILKRVWIPLDIILTISIAMY